MNIEDKSRDTNNKNKSNIAIFKIIIISTFLFIIFLLLQHYKILNFSNNRNNKNLDDLFDVSKETSSDLLNEVNDILPDITANELQEKGIDFFYRIFLKNQVQINALQQEISHLKADLANYKNSEKAVKIIFAYIDFRQKILSGQISGKSFDNSLENIELLSNDDLTIKSQINIIKPIITELNKTENNIDLQLQFSQLIPEIIATKQYNENNSWNQKIKHYFAKLITIRKIDKNDPEIDNIDKAIIEIENNLKNKNYIEVARIGKNIDSKYQNILTDFNKIINYWAEIQKIDQEIFNYLKDLK